MAIRIRKNGQLLCAAMYPQKSGDTYVDDNLHYEMSVVHKVIGSEPMEKHIKNGRWYWLGNVPKGVKIDSFYLKEKN